MALADGITSVLALVMLFIGGLAAYTFVWDLGDVGVGLMTIFNMIVLFPMSGQALKALREYKGSKEKKRTKKMPAGEEIPVPAEQSAGEGGL